jgi:hypothetical protein
VSLIQDPTTSTAANVVAASTPAPSTDAALVVALSPNSPLPAGTNSIGAVTIASSTTTIFRLLSAATTNATSIKASAGVLYGWSIQNTNAAQRYVKLYNKASSPTVGTDTPVITLLIPGASAGAGNNLGGLAINFSTGIALATTVNPTDSDTTVVALDDLIINLFYI